MKSDVRFYHINNQYMAYIELRENWIIIGIALKCKWLLFIPDYKIVSWYKLFLIVNDDYKSDRTTGCCIEMGIRHSIVTLVEHQKHIHIQFKI